MKGFEARRFLNQQSFVLGIGLAVGLAWLAPGFGSEDGVLPTRALESAGVFVIFLLQGLSLPFEELRRGVAQWRLHATVQGTTFLFFPLVTLLGLHLFPGLSGNESIRAGFLYLSFLPSTIASAMTLSVAAKGNASGALFNTTLSNGVGVFLVPFLCLILISTGGSARIEVQPVLIGILLKIIVPLILGQFLRIKLAGWAARHRVLTRRISNGVILFMIYSAFCDSFARRLWSGLEQDTLWWTICGVVSLLIAVSAFLWFLSIRVRLDRPSRVTALFCGSQKTLAVGLPLAVMIFGSRGSDLELSLVIVPLLLYHPLQLVVGGLLVGPLKEFVERSR